MFLFAILLIIAGLVLLLIGTGRRHNHQFIVSGAVLTAIGAVFVVLLLL